MFLLGKRCDTLNRMDKWMDVIVTEYFSKKMGKVILNANDFVGTIYRNSGHVCPTKKGCSLLQFGDIFFQCFDLPQGNLE